MHKKNDPLRDERIYNEIVCDCNDEEEQMLGWWNYLEEILKFPFKAKCIKKISTSPLAVNSVVEVVGIGEIKDYTPEVFLTITWQDNKLDVPISQLEPINVDAETREAMQDWQYWSRDF